MKEEKMSKYDTISHISSPLTVHAFNVGRSLYTVNLQIEGLNFRKNIKKRKKY